MRTGLLLTLVAGLALSATPAMAQHNHGGAAKPAQAVPAPTAAQPVVGDAPQITFEQASRSLGLIDDDKPVDAEFTFQNTGKSELQIMSTTGSCGCTVPELAKKVYAPGEKGTIKVSYNPNNRRGKQHTTVTVVSNDPARPSVALDVHSDVRPQLMLDPQVVTFGSVAKGTPASVRAFVVTRRADLKPTVASANLASVDVTIGEPIKETVEGEELTKYPLNVVLKPGSVLGPLNGQVTIRTNDASRFLNLPFTGEMQGDVAANPQRVQLPGLSPGQAINSTIRISHRTGGELKLVSAEEAPLGAPMFTVQVAPDPAGNSNSFIVTLAGKAPETQGAFRGDIVLTTSVAGEEKVKIPYFGFVSPQRQQPQNPAGGPPSAWDNNPSMLLKPR